MDRTYKDVLCRNLPSTIKKKKIQMPIKKIEKPIKETGTKINVTRVLKGLKPGKYTNCGHNKKL